MVMALTTKNKISFIDGSIPCPESDDLLFGMWIHCNNMVISWILNSVHKDIANSLLYFDTAVGIWNDLRDKFHQSNGPRIFHIKKHLIALSQGSLDVSTYYTRLKILWDELKGFQPLPECACVAANDSNSTVAILAAKLNSKPKKDRPTCSHCGILGHTVDKCYKLYGYPPRYKFKSKNPRAKAQANQTSSRTTEASATLIALLSSQLHDNTPATPELQQPGPSVSSFNGIFSISSVSFPNSLDSSAWVLDTGATHHVCCSLPSFVSSVPTSNSSVTLPNGHLVSISRIGSVQLSPHITLTDGHSQAKMIGMGKLHGNLYVLDFSSLVSQSFDISATYNAPELAFSDFFRAQGILSFHSCIETPQQNSVVERKHQHILNSNCILIVVYLINRTPSPLLINKTPFELLFKKKPSYSHLKAFGCLCYASTLNHSRTKFSPRAIKVVFLGYPPGYKAYKLLNLSTNTTFISGDVIFNESIFPFQNDDSQPCHFDFFSDLVLPLPISISSNDSTNPSFSPISFSLDRPTRSRRAPSYLQDYHCSSTSFALQSTCHPLSQVLDYHKLSTPHTSLVNAISSNFEPITYAEVAVIPEWQTAMSDELRALKENSTWSLTTLPRGKHTVGCKWVYRIKYRADGTIERYKARLVAKGYTQQEGVDYLDTFSPVAKLVTVKVLLALAAVHGWSLTQLDVNNAFLHGDLHEEVYMSLPPGLYHERESLPINTVCKLHNVLVNTGFKQSASDNSLFVKINGNSFIALLVYVDDIVIASNDQENVDELKKFLNGYFKLKDLGNLKYFLGLEVGRSSKGISVSQRHYALQLLSDTGYLGCKTRKTLMDPNVKLSQDEGDLLDDPSMYRRMIGKLLYLTITRPDLSFSYHVLQDVKATVGQGLFYSSSSAIELKAFANSDWAACPRYRRSISGFCVFIGDSLVS
ncbi:hypothetical protein AAG906_003816 [Vitis piasezkii]